MAYVQWIVMMLVGVGIGLLVGKMFALTAAFLWIMGCFYNIPPARTKDVPYLDVLTESINNPLRMLLGWYAVTSVMANPLVPPVSLLVSYWMIGCYFMALKRFSEFNEIGDKALAGSYRASFKRYTPESLLVSVMFYASTAMLFFGAFILRYRIELILAFPLVAMDHGDLLQTRLQARKFGPKPGETLQRTHAHGSICLDGRRDGFAALRASAAP